MIINFIESESLIHQQYYCFYFIKETSGVFGYTVSKTLINLLICRHYGPCSFIVGVDLYLAEGFIAIGMMMS